MDLTKSLAEASRLVALETSQSTNSELIAAVAADPQAWPHLSVMVTDHQTAGRGRLGRSWSAPAGTSLAVSVLLRDPRSTGTTIPERWAWLPMLAGLAMVRAVDAVGPAAPASLKWPNDVLIAGGKVCGILAEVVPGTATVVVGAGINLTMQRDDLPVPTATSLTLVGTDVPSAELADAVLSVYLRELDTLVRRLDQAGDAAAAGLVDEVAKRCETLGRQVRVEFPDGSMRFGVARALASDGRLILIDERDQEPLAVAAGDVTHLRY